MIIQSFFALMDDAAPHVRAEAVGVLANAFLSASLGAENPNEVEAALSMVLDDPSPKVRRVLAIAFAEQRDVPRHIILSLAADQPEVSALLIARSPLLKDVDLIELARSAEGLALVAIALRPQVSDSVCAMLVSRDVPAIHLALARNPDAEIRESDLLKIAQMPDCMTDTREAILGRRHVPGMVRHALMVHVARSLGGFASKGRFVPAGRNARMIDDTIRDATISIAAKQPGEMQAFVRYLRQNAFLTPALILRSVLGGNLAFLAYALAELSEIELSKVAGLVKGRSVAALSALFRRADLPQFLEMVLIDAVRAAQSLRETLPADGLSLIVIQAAQSSLISAQDGETARLLALLRRFEAEAARAQSRKLADDLLERVRKERHDMNIANAPVAQLEMQSEACDFEEMQISSLDVSSTTSIEVEAEVESTANCLECEAIRAPINLKALIAEWRLESEKRHPELVPQALMPNNSDDFMDWEIRGAA